MTLGVHFALTSDQVQGLLRARTDAKRREFVEQTEEAWEKGFVCETDKAWDAIHRCLTDGELLYENGEYPLNHCICGGRQLFRGRGSTLSFVTAEQVVDVATAMKPISRPWLWKRYQAIDPDDYEFDVSPEDFEYVWENFKDLRAFYQRAAKAGRAVLFSCDS